MTRTSYLAAAVLAVAAVATACGGSSTSPSTGGGGTGGGGTGGGSVNTTTITITSAGASPRDITITAGSRVTFVNNNNQPHDMASNPHPEHTDCPALVAFVTPGQSATTLNLNTVRTCGFHDHNQPTNTNLQGVIRIQ
jgi:plastocyanin